jgi:uncharacterized protein YecE (DUF72 family)
MENFYPRGLREIDRLAFYATRFAAIELNTTFHATPAPNNVRRWKNVTPSDFRFSIKFLKALTHGHPGRLLETDAIEMTKHFFDVIQELGEKLAVILMQFPPRFSVRYHSTLLHFLDYISCPTRLVLEFRHDSWWTPVTARTLREREIGWTVADLGSYPEVAKVPKKGEQRLFGLRPIVSTADFLYIRWIGKHHQFPQHSEEHFDSTARITWWFERLTRVFNADPNIRRVYAFFDNDFSGHAPTAARRFADKVNLPRFYETSFVPVLPPSLYPV